MIVHMTPKRDPVNDPDQFVGGPNNDPESARIAMPIHGRNRQPNGY